MLLSSVYGAGGLNVVLHGYMASILTEPSPQPNAGTFMNQKGSMRPLRQGSGSNGQVP